jgi:hypothetical protein
MKGVLLLCLINVHVDKKIFKKNLHIVHEKKKINTNLNHKVPAFWESLN